MKKLISFGILLLTCFNSAFALIEEFVNPPQEAKPIVIWQWMNGVVSKEGITRDLEAFAKAGIGGVQNFQIGGKIQTHLSDSSVTIGSPKWKDLMRHAINECARLGLSFGTHNCPGWSSSAYPTVKPEDSMQKIVWSYGERPEVDSLYNYYEDIVTLAVPANKDVVKISEIIEVRSENQTVPDGYQKIRIGHTTNGRTNGNNSPESGMGLECDKMSKEAVRKYWSSYPAMLLEIAGEHAGKTFSRIEIDSYEAGAQDWTPLMMEEFKQRTGYDLLPWLVNLTLGSTVESEEATAKFKADWKNVIEDLYAENYYGEMSRLVHQTTGMKLLVQPYGKPLDTAKVCAALPDDLLCCEFWTRPSNWGGRSAQKMGKIVREGRLFGEGFTAWPLKAWSDAPSDLKPIADHNFTLGVNSMMLHAAAQNPWGDNAVPGMAFGKWGTQFSPNQTWWTTGGKAFFSYLARCQALLQQGVTDDDLSALTMTEGVECIHKKNGNDDIYFVVNAAGRVGEVEVLELSGNRHANHYNPMTGEAYGMKPSPVSRGWKHKLSLNPGESAFIVMEKTRMPEERVDESVELLTEIPGPWRISFPGISEIETDKLQSWTENSREDIKYHSGAATYTARVNLPLKTFRKNRNIGNSFILDLGNVWNVAVVRVNGSEKADTLWMKPFAADITDLLHAGDNEIEITVINLWTNRMIGDEHYPDDAEWSEPFVYEYTPEKPEVGRFLESVPQWVKDGTQRPSANRKTFTDFKFFTDKSELVPSGLLGPVMLMVSRKNKQILKM